VTHRHGWPCVGGDGELLGTAPFLTVVRCARCGSITERWEKGGRRATVARLRSDLGIAVPPFRLPALDAPPPIERVSAQLNQGALYRLLLETAEGTWTVHTGGAVVAIPGAVPATADPIDPDDAVELVRRTWGDPAAGALQLGLAVDLDLRVMRALDLAQWSPAEIVRAWEPRAASVVAAMLAAGPDRDAMIAAAVRLVLDEGRLAIEDVVAAGFAV
jgi:hypothetical protein